MWKRIKLGICCLALLLSASCQRSSNQTWEDMKTAGSYLNRSIAAVFGKYDDSIAVTNSKNEMPEEEFLGLEEADSQKGDFAISQPRYLPGEKGSPIPGFAFFKSPQGRETAVFQRLHFATDDHIVRSRADLIAIEKIARYLKNHPQCAVCIEGHCDERAPASYNLALGSRRANQVRVLLIKKGVGKDQLYPISYGKERPLRPGHSKEDWEQNRRCEFKLYTKQKK